MWDLLNADLNGLTNGLHFTVKEFWETNFG